MGHPKVSVGHPEVSVGHPEMSVGHLGVWDIRECGTSRSECGTSGSVGHPEVSVVSLRDCPARNRTRVLNKNNTTCSLLRFIQALSHLVLTAIRHIMLSTCYR